LQGNGAVGAETLQKASFPKVIGGVIWKEAVGRLLLLVNDVTYDRIYDKHPGVSGNSRLLSYST
jgi:hypothetical protein